MITADEAQIQRQSGPPRIALTGRISSGKSTVLSIFADRGAAVLSTDSVVHELLAGDHVRQQISRELDIDSVVPGDAGRKQLADAAFNDASKLQRLQQVLFPLVRERVEDWLKQPEQRNAPIAVIEVPMLLEAGMESLFDYIILITAPEVTRKARRAKEIDTGDFERRNAEQMPDAEREPFCHIVFENTGSLDDLEELVDRAIELAGASGE